MAYKLGAAGKHMAMNSLIVLGMVDLLGGDLALAALSLQDFSPAAAAARAASGSSAGGRNLHAA